MSKPSSHVAMAAAAAGLCLWAHGPSFAAPQVEPARQTRAFSKAATPAMNAAWEPHTEPASGTSSSLPGFALSAAIGLTMGARSRMRRQATKTPEETYEAVVQGGEVRLAQSAGEVILSGIVTGFYIGFGGVLCSTVGGSALKLPAGLQRFMFGAIGFPLSIFLTTIAGGQGFTPNVTVMASAFYKKGADRLGKMIANLCYAYLGNAIGLITIAAMANWGALPAVPAAITIAKHKVFDYGFWEILVRGILGGWLIGLAVYTSQAAEDVASKFVTIWLCISTYVICQYEHCLANLFFVPCAIFGGANISWAQFIEFNLIPSTIGNAIGGFALLAAFYRAIYGKNKKKEAEDQMSLASDMDFEKA